MVVYSLFWQRDCHYSSTHYHWHKTFSYPVLHYSSTPDSTRNTAVRVTAVVYHTAAAVGTQRVLLWYHTPAAGTQRVHRAILLQYIPVQAATARLCCCNYFCCTYSSTGITMLLYFWNPQHSTAQQNYCCLLSVHAQAALLYMICTSLPHCGARACNLAQVMH